MAKRRNAFEIQALASVGLLILGALCMFGLAFCLFTAFDPELGVVYKQNGMRWYAILGSTGLGLAASGIGMLVGFNSAGQKSNPRSKLSWIGFFANAGVVTFTMSLFVFFFFMRFAVVE